VASILIIEDDQAVRHVCAVVLRRAGYSVLEAGSADEAEHVWQRHPVDLAVVDLVLPGGGTECALQLIQFNPHAKLLFVSSWPMNWREPDADNMHRIPEEAHEILTKPFAPEQLVQKVRELLGERLAGAGG
jgi:two-component system phosphate regulon response regulator PhoB